MNTWTTKAQQNTATKNNPFPNWTPTNPEPSLDYAPTTQTGPVFTQDPLKVEVVTDAQVPLELNKALVRFNVEYSAFTIIEGFTSLEIDINSRESIKTVEEAKKRTRDQRLSIQRKVKKVNAEILKRKKELKTDTDTIINRLKVVEDYLNNQLQILEDHKAKMAEAARLEEAARVDKIKENMWKLTEYCEAGLKQGLTSEQIKKALNNLTDIEIPQDIFQEKYQDACNLLAHAIDATQIALKVRVEWEKAEAVRKEQEERLEQQGIINDQVAWFNRVFGIGSTVDVMEKGLESLDRVNPYEYMVDLLEKQKIQAQEIIVKARAAKVEKDRLDADLQLEKLHEEALVMDAKFDALIQEISNPVAITDTNTDTGTKNHEVKMYHPPQPNDDAATIREAFLGLKAAFPQLHLASPDAHRVWCGMSDQMRLMEKHVSEYLKTQGVKYAL